MKYKVIQWIPRILGILAILFMMMFSLDCFGENEKIGEQLMCLLMHNIPAFICLSVLIIAWKWERIGGILFILVFIAAAIFFRSFTGNSASLVVISPFLLAGILFILSSLQNRNEHKSVPDSNLKPYNET